MVIVKIWAGLGNQMFQYALSKKLELLGFTVLLDVNWFTGFKCFNGYELPEIFDGFKGRYATLQECNQLAYTQYNLINRIKRKALPRKQSHYIESRDYKYYSYNEKILQYDGRYLEGYFQTERYFEDVKDDIVKTFTFKLPANYNKAIIKRITNNNSVSVHIRRGDYLSGSQSKRLLCNSMYYKNAIGYCSEKIDNPKYFIFSDDIPWCKNYFRDMSNIEFVDQNSGSHSYLDMYLMSLCKHNIVANSSFSWWGAWLNKNADKIVLAPYNWNNQNLDPRYDFDLIPKNWHVIKY